MMLLPQPPRVEQPGGGFIPDLSCWAAAICMWQAVTPGRKRENVTGMEDRFRAMKPSPMKYNQAMNRWGLDGSRFYIVAADHNIHFSWRYITGAEITKWDLELLLQTAGYVYFVAKLGEGSVEFSHARVLYGADDDFKVGHFVDPSAKFPTSVSWPYADMVKFNFLMAVRQGGVPFGQDNKWENIGTGD